MTPIKGDFSKIFLASSVDLVYKIAGCTTGDTINFNNELVEVTGPTSDFVAVKPTYRSGTLTADMVFITALGGDPQMASDILLTWDKAKLLLKFIYQWLDGSTPYEISGDCYIASLSINGAAQEFTSVQISLQISGEWFLDF